MSEYVEHDSRGAVVAWVAPSAFENTRNSWTRQENGDVADRAVRAMQDYVRTSGTPVGRIGPPEEALTPEQATWYHEDEIHRQRLVESDGGEVGVFEGVLLSEETDPWVADAVLSWRAHQRAKEALAALDAYEASWSVRAGYRLYRGRLWAQGRALAFWSWLQR